MSDCWPLFKRVQDEKASSSLILVELEGLPLCLSNLISSLKLKWLVLSRICCMARNTPG
jgi:hypothetical protein